MQQSYSKNYIKIYFWQILSILLGFCSLFVVVPYISTNQTTYGIYTVCISVTIFLSYADLGFLGAGMKYAAESFSRGEEEKEIELVGFSHFILLIFVLILSCIFLFLSFNPQLLIKGLEGGTQQTIAHKLLLILAIFTPVVVIQRMLQMIFGIRLQEYKLQRINIIGSIIKISSVFYFFGRGKYDIVSYFLFIQIISLIVALVGIWLASYTFKYNFKYLFTKLKFSKQIFHHTKSLAFSSFFGTIAWVLYYELDSVAIGKMLGAQAVALYSIGLTILGFIRSLLGVFFSPFSARFNHFIGLGMNEELKKFYLHIIQITLPLVVFPIIAVVIMAHGIVISWVGSDYEQSVRVLQYLVLCNILGFISYPAGMLLVAREKMRQMYVINIMMPFIFWGGVLITIDFWGINSFAIFKLVAFILSGLIYIWLSLKFLDISLWKFLKTTIIPHIPSIIIIIIILVPIQDICTTNKNKLNLLINFLIVICGILVALLVSLSTCKPMRDYAKKTIKLLR